MTTGNYLTTIYSIVFGHNSITFVNISRPNRKNITIHNNQSEMKSARFELSLHGKHQTQKL